MKTKFALSVTVAALASVLSSAAVAEPPHMRGAPPFEAALPPYEINAIVRSMGFDPLTYPQRRGPYYVLNAIDPRGFEMRVVADARIGAVVAIMPAPMRYDGGPRIVHVPQDAVGALPDDPDEADMTPEERDSLGYDRHDRPGYDDRRVTAPAPALAPRKPPVKSAAVPPAAAPSAPPVSHAPPRAVLAPPPSLSDGPTPIRPLPKLGKTERFSSPDPKTTADDPPPPAPQAEAGEARKPADTAPGHSIEMTPVAPLE